MHENSGGTRSNLPLVEIHHDADSIFLISARMVSSVGS